MRVGPTLAVAVRRLLAKHVVVFRECAKLLAVGPGRVLQRAAGTRGSAVAAELELGKAPETAALAHEPLVDCAFGTGTVAVTGSCACIAHEAGTATTRRAHGRYAAENRPSRAAVSSFC